MSNACIALYHFPFPRAHLLYILACCPVPPALTVDLYHRSVKVRGLVIPVFLITR